MRFFEHNLKFTSIVSILSIILMSVFVYYSVHYHLWENVYVSMLYNGILGDIAKIVFYKITLVEKSLVSHGLQDRVPIVTFTYISCFWISVVFSIIALMAPKPEKEYIYRNDYKELRKHYAVLIILFIYLFFYRDFDYGMSERLGDRGHVYNSHFYWIIIYTGGFVEATAFALGKFYFYLKSRRCNQGGQDV